MTAYSPHVLTRPDAMSYEYDGETGSSAGGDRLPTIDDGIADRDDGISRRDVARVLFKHKYLILATFLIVSAVAAAGLLMLPPTYATRAKILIRADQQADPAFFSGLAALNEPRTYETGGRRLETEMALLEVIPVSAQVVQDQHLSYDQVYHSARRFFMVPLLEASDRLRSTVFGTRPKDRRGMGATVGEFQSGLDVQPAPARGPDAMSDIVVVTLRAPDPVIAQRSLTALLDAYLQLDARINEDAGTAALRIVKAETDEATGHLAVAEQRLRDFLATHSAQSTSLRAQAVSPAADGAALARLKARLVELEISLLNARRVYRPESEQVRSLERQIADLRARVEVDVAGDASDFARETQLRRDVREAESRYDQLLARVEGISLFLQVSTQQVGQRVIIEPPGLPTSSDWQKRLLLGIVAAVLGFVLGLLFAGVRELSDQTLATKRDVARSLGLDTVAVLPEAERADVRAAIRTPAGVDAPDATRAELTNAFRDMASSLRGVLAPARPLDAGGRVLLVTSARRGEGTSTVSAGLAAQLAGSARGQVLVVEDRPGPPRTGDATATVDVASRWTWPSDQAEGARTGVAAPARSDETDRAADVEAKAASFLAEARRRYRWVILDGGSIAAGAAGAVAPLVDGILVVVEAEWTRKQVVRDALRRLSGFSGRFVAVVLNRQRHHIPRFLYERL